MKKKFLTLILLSIFFVFSNAIITAQDDPFADMGLPGEPGFDMGADDPLAGMDMGAGDDPFAGMDAGGDDPMAGMDAGGDDPMAGMDMGAGDDPFAGMDAGGDDPMAGMDMGAGDDPFGGMDTGADPFGTGDDTDAMAGTDPFGDPGSGDDLFGDMGLDSAPAASTQAKAPAAKTAAAPRKTGPVEIQTIAEAGGFYRTDEVRTSKGYLGDFPSLKDYIDYRMRASSYLDSDHSPENMSDVRADSVWVEKNITGGRGQSVTIDFAVGSFSGVYEEYMKKAKINEIRFLNGNCRSREEWENSYRPMRVRLLLNNKVVAYINMRDTMNWQTAKFKSPILVGEGDILKAEFVEVFPSVRREDDKRVAITEIALIGDYQ